MRQVDCPCGRTLTGADDAELNRIAHEHAAQDHPDEGISDEFLANHIAQNARDAVST
jgi:predicted small metal-binding protein